MEITEQKREMNNFLLREYLSNPKKECKEKSWLYILINNNLDLVAYTISKNFSEHKYKQNIYQIGINGLIKAIETYQMDKIASFEEFVISVITNEISNYIKEPELKVIIDNNKSGLTIGDIWYSKNHDLDNLLATKPYREKMLTKIYKIVK